MEKLEDGFQIRHSLISKTLLVAICGDRHRNLNQGRYTGLFL